MDDRLDSLKKALLRNIVLHERLKETILAESVSIEELSPEKLHEANMREKALELEIERTNRVISDLYEDCTRLLPRSNDETRREIGSLMERLRRSIRESLGAVGETIVSVRNARSGVVEAMRDLNRRSAAAASYAKAKFI